MSIAFDASFSFSLGIAKMERADTVSLGLPVMDCMLVFPPSLCIEALTPMGWYLEVSPLGGD